MTDDVNDGLNEMKENQRAKRGEKIFGYKLLIVIGRYIKKLGNLEVGGMAAKFSFTRHSAWGNPGYRGCPLS